LRALATLAMLATIDNDAQTLPLLLLGAALTAIPVLLS
jgi:hypothetical protein